MVLAVSPPVVAGTTAGTFAAGNDGRIVAAAGGGVLINSLGDSISAQPFYYNAPPGPNFPAWAPGQTYAANQCCRNGGFAFYSSNAGTTASSGTGPAFSTNTVTDGTIQWTPIALAGASKTYNAGGFLSWAEKFSKGLLNFDMSIAYPGSYPNVLDHVVVASGGSGYTNPTIAFSQGATGTVQMSGGVITGVTVTNPGHGTGGFSTAVISDPTGSGAAAFCVQGGSGTWGVGGCTTASMVARLPEVVASPVPIITVLGGTNDYPAGMTYAQTIANLRTCYETLMAAGKKVVAITITPRAYNTTTRQSATLMRVARWQRAYCRGETWANPLGLTRDIALADVHEYWTDGTNAALCYPIGGTSGSALAVTLEGLHPSVRGGVLLGYVVWQAALKFLPLPAATSPRMYSAADGYDPTYNPGGNLLEGLPWQAGTPYALGALCSNNGNVYRCYTAGTSAASGGPTATSGTMVDGSNGLSWLYVRPAGTSVFMGTAGTMTAATGITFSGSLASGMTLLRTAGTASGTVACSIENPWSDGHVGQRQVITFSLGGGNTFEQWNLRTVYAGYAAAGLQLGELGVTAMYGDAEIEFSAFSAFSGAYLSSPYDPNAGFYNADGPVQSGVNARMPGFAGDVIALPNGGRMLLRTQPLTLPSNLGNLCHGLYFDFDASGAAGSATLTVKLNHQGMFKAGVA